MWSSFTTQPTRLFLVGPPYKKVTIIITITIIIVIINIIINDIIINNMINTDLSPDFVYTHEPETMSVAPDRLYSKKMRGRWEGSMANYYL